LRNDDDGLTQVEAFGGMPVRLLPNLDSLIFIEVTGAHIPHRFHKEDREMTARLSDPLGYSNNDFWGVYGHEPYDVFYSDPDGSFNLNGECVTVEATFIRGLPAGGVLNIAEVYLKFTDGSLKHADFVTSYLALGDNAIPSSAANAADGDEKTFTEMGNTVGQKLRLRVTVGYRFAPEPGGRLDIKPGSCPNPLNVKSKDALPVAILGAEDLDAKEIDTSTILLEGVAPVRWSYEDVATPFSGELCDCWAQGPDGFEDLTLKFSRQDIVRALGPVNDRDTIEVTATWKLLDGTEMEGSDCIVILKKPAAKKNAQLAGTRSSESCEAPGLQISPNPIRDRSSMYLILHSDSHMILTIHDITGATIETVADQELAAGWHTLDWNPQLPSGTYFCRLQTDGYNETRRMTVIR